MKDNVFNLLAAVCTGCVIGLSLAGLHLFWLAWVMLVPFFVIIRRVKLSIALILAMLVGIAESLVFWCGLPFAIYGMMHKLAVVIGACSVLVFYWSLFFALFVLLVHFVWKINNQFLSVRWSRIVSIAAPPVIWVVLEYFHTQLMTHLSLIFFPSFSFSQSFRSEFVQVAAFTGGYGISFLIVLCNAAIAQAIIEKKPKVALFAVLVVALSFSFGVARIRMGNFSGVGTPVRVAIIQGNIKAYEKFDKSKSEYIAQRYIGLCKEAVATNPDLVVWSETAIPWALSEDDDLAEEALRITAPSKACHIIGAPFLVPGSVGIYHNSAFLVLPDGRVTSQYNKLRMLAFAEIAVGMPGSKKPVKMHPSSPTYICGDILSILTSPFGEIGVNLCNENFYAYLNRRVVLRGGEFIAHLANDIWFDVDMPLREHFSVNVIRAVEAGRDTIVGNNAGISGIIDAYGRVKCMGPIRTHVCLSGDVFRNTKKTFYVKYGDVFVYICMVFFVLFFLLPYLIVVRHKNVA